MKSDIFSISGFFRWNRTDDSGISNACREFANAGTRFLAADAETCWRARKMAGKQACKMAEKRTFRIKNKNVLSAAPVPAPRFERFSQSVLF